MNNTTNLSAPTSPVGISTVEAVADKNSSKTPSNSHSNAADQQQQNSDQQQEPAAKMARSRSLSDMPPRDSPGEGPPAEKQQIDSKEPATPATEGLKVKIKTNNITAQPVLINHDRSSSSPAENGKKATSSASASATPPPPPLPTPSSSMPNRQQQPRQQQPHQPQQQQPPVQLAQPAQQSTPLQTQSQQPPLPLAPSSQPPPTISPTRLPVSTPSAPATASQPTPKPKTTRAKKQAAASNKNANASNAITPLKPEAKARTKKAKQTADSKAPPAPLTAASTTPASTQLQANKSPGTLSQAASAAAPSSAIDKTVTGNQRPAPTATTSPTKKRKPRAPPATTGPNAQQQQQQQQPPPPPPPSTNPPKRTRKKKEEVKKTTTTTTNETPINPPMSTNMTLPPLSVNPQLLSVASSIPMGASPLMSNAPQASYQSMQPLSVNRGMPGMSPHDVHDQRYMSVATLSPYANHDYTNSLARQHSLSKLLFTSSSSASTSAIQTNPHSEEIAKAFEDLREHSWSHLSKCILEPAQQFDIPSLIGTLYELRADNERQAKKVKDLTLQREQLAAMNAKLDLSGPMLLQNLNQTSSNFASVVASLQNSPKSLPNSSPSPAMNKSPIVPGGAYNHVPPGSSLGPPGILYDRNSSMVGLQTQHSGINSLKSSMISTPSPPTSAFMAHGANNRAGLMTVNNPPYMSNIHPSMSALNQLGGTAAAPPPSYYPTRQ